MARECGCGSCEDWRKANGIAEPADVAEAARMTARFRELAKGRAP